MRKVTPLGWAVAFGWALAGMAHVASAQTLDMASPTASAEVATPVRGTSMAQVERQFGAPAERFAPVGQPPITRWVYADKVVYFEYEHVVHAVVVRR